MFHTTNDDEVAGDSLCILVMNGFALFLFPPLHLLPAYSLALTGNNQLTPKDLPNYTNN